MPAENYVNDVYTTLSGNGGSVNNSTTTWLVASSTGFPSKPFRVICESEIVLVTNVVGVTWTVTRAQESTTATSHNDGSIVRHVITAAGLSNAIQYASRWDVVSTFTNYSASVSEFVKCNTAGGGITVTLPTAVGQSGKEIGIQKISSDNNILLVNTTSSQTISGELTQYWNDQYTVMTVVSDGANWQIT